MRNLLWEFLGIYIKYSSWCTYRYTYSESTTEELSECVYKCADQDEYYTWMPEKSKSTFLIK